MQSQDPPPQSPLVISYLSLRKAIGFIGLGLPFVLVIGKMLLNGLGIQGSISDYYYTSMRNVFVGSLCAIGIFLISYRGFDKRDRIAGALACLFAVGVALFPTRPGVDFTEAQKWIGRVHLTFAACLFLTLAYFSLALFRRTAPDRTMTLQKKQRNGVYTVCGYTILACIALIVLCELLFLNDYSPYPNTGIQNLDPVFWFESIAVVSFGVSWLTKGEAILADPDTPFAL